MVDRVSDIVFFVPLMVKIHLPWIVSYSTVRTRSRLNFVKYFAVGLDTFLLTYFDLLDSFFFVLGVPVPLVLRLAGLAVWLQSALLFVEEIFREGLLTGGTGFHALKDYRSFRANLTTSREVAQGGIRGLVGGRWGEKPP